jgi:hypothetical protein
LLIDETFPVFNLKSRSSIAVNFRQSVANQQYIPDIQQVTLNAVDATNLPLPDSPCMSQMQQLKAFVTANHNCALGSMKQ